MHFIRNCKNQKTKNRSEVIVTSYGRNKNRDDKKNQQKAKYSPSYRCASIKNDFNFAIKKFESIFCLKSSVK